MSLARWTVAISLATIGHSQTDTSSAVLFDGARIIVGDGTKAIEHGAFLVQNGRFVAVGRQGALRAPARAMRVNLAGKTVMPAMINVHAHLGYEGYTSWGAENYTLQNLLNHVER